MRRKYLTIENVIAGILACAGLTAAIVVRDIGLRICFAELGGLALFYLILCILDTKKTICGKCGSRIWDRRNRSVEAKRIDTLDESGDLVRITVICPRCGSEKLVWKK